jgi:hypothetical protein
MKEKAIKQINSQDLLPQKELIMPEKLSRASPRYRKKNPPLIRLMQRDIDILWSLLHYRLMDMPMLVRRHFQGSSSKDGGWATAKRRLRLLWDHKLLDRHWLPTMEIGRNPYVFTLGSTGAAKLRALGADPEAIERCLRYNPRFKPMFAEHALVLARFRLCFDLLPEYEWVDYLDEATLKSKQYEALQAAKKQNLPAEEVARWVPYYTEKKSGKIVHTYPDFYFVQCIGELNFPIFLEIDRATTTLKRFRRKIRAYQQYRESGWLKELYGFHDFSVFTVTTSPTRLANLIAASEAEVGEELTEIALEKTRRFLHNAWGREPTPAEIEKQHESGAHFRDRKFWFTLEKNIDLDEPLNLVKNQIWHIAIGNMITSLEGIKPVMERDNKPQT